MPGTGSHAFSHSHSHAPHAHSHAPHAPHAHHAHRAHHSHSNRSRAPLQVWDMGGASGAVPVKQGKVRLEAEWSQFSIKVELPPKRRGRPQAVTLCLGSLMAASACFDDFIVTTCAAYLPISDNSCASSP